MSPMEMSPVEPAAHADAKSATEPADHQQLRARLSALRAATDRAAVNKQLSTLHPFLLDHFAHEERAGGYFDEVLQQAPHQQSTIARLKDDHRTLLSQLEGTSAQLKTTSEGALDSAAQDLIRALIDKLQAHEQVEEMLLQDALESDLGVGD